MYLGVSTFIDLNLNHSGSRKVLTKKDQTVSPVLILALGILIGLVTQQTLYILKGDTISAELRDLQQFREDTAQTLADLSSTLNQQSDQISLYL